MDVKPFGGTYRGRRVLITGHTGFKGSWLAAWLVQMGAEVTGFSLNPDTTPNHWDLLRLPIADLRGDIRDLSAIQEAVHASHPEIVFHLSAQPLVRRSYQDPLETWSTNVMGTANVLEACRKAKNLAAVVVVTTDKVYANKECAQGYREDDRLGGHDPYSASKAACELVVDSYRKAFFGDSAPLIATARAGNVVGGGDWSVDRLIPDVVRAVNCGQSLEVRSPDATRPWQHVLECSAAYLVLGEHLLAGKRAIAQAWNFGPNAEDNRTVASILTELQTHWPELRWHRSEAQHPHEAGLLFLDSSKAEAILGWRPVWNLSATLAATANWYRQHALTQQPPTYLQLSNYVESAVIARSPWAVQ
jgi:CDP-glucose 4,6-dehydratase